MENVRTQIELKEKLTVVSSTCMELAKSLGTLSARVSSLEEGRESITLLSCVQKILLDAANKADDYIVYGRESIGDGRGLFGRAPLLELLTAAWRAASGCWTCFHRLANLLAEKVVPHPTACGDSIGGQHGGYVEVSLRVAGHLLQVAENVNELFVAFSPQDWATCGKTLRTRETKPGMSDYAENHVSASDPPTGADAAAISLQLLSHEIMRLSKEKELHLPLFAALAERDERDNEKAKTLTERSSGKESDKDADKEREAFLQSGVGSPEMTRSEGDNRSKIRGHKRDAGANRGASVAASHKGGLLRRLLSRGGESADASPAKEEP